jgi:guanosine-3',5'-bis(diphosphate) 3'-pyrophosphohydrolase
MKTVPMIKRAEFFERLKPFHAPSSLLDIELAYTLAKYSHRAQVRMERDAKGDQLRYFEHVKRVALILIDEVRIPQEEMVIAALLHDGIEDTRDLTPEMIEHVFGPDVVTIVKTLSKVPKEGYLDRFRISTDFRPYVIKACDRLDNLRSLGSASVDFQQKQIRETREKYYPLFDRMVELTPTHYRAAVAALREQVIVTTDGHECDMRSIDTERSGA